MSTILRGIPLKTIESELRFVCHDWHSRFQYVDNRRTDTILGEVYDVTNIESYNRYHVFVPDLPPVMDMEEFEQIQENGQKLFLEFQDATVTPYYNERSRSIEDSIRAKGVRIVKEF